MKISRITELAWFTIITIVLCLAFLALRSNQQKQFSEINANYENKLAVDLSADFDVQTLANLLIDANYVSDDTSAFFIAEHIKTRLAQEAELPNLGELNKRSFRISADSIDSKGGSYLKNRVESSRKSLGITDSLPATAENSFDLKSGAYEITVKVQQFDSTANFILKKLDKNLKSVPDVLVQLSEHYYDSLNVAQEFVLGYAKTDKKGIATFKGLKAEGYYSILPIQKGFEYGNQKGTVKGNLAETKNRTFIFTQREHQITPFDSYTYANLKEDNAVTVRPPQEYQGNLASNLIFILLAWWVLHFYLVWRKKKTDQFILPLIMLLSGICLLIMYSIHNPLTDKMLGNDMAQGILAGIVLIGLLSEINFVTFFNSNYKFLGRFGGLRKIPFDIVRTILIGISGLFGKKMKERVKKLPEGSGYLILALFLTFLLFFFGTSPQAGVKVNLFFFQPSEIAKYLIILFLAVFFYHNDKKIQTFSSNFSKTGLKIQFRTILTVILSLGALLLMYLILGDMGPALVIAGTFIIIYSFIRKDLIELLIGLCSFVIFLKVASWLVPHSQSVLFAATVAWFLFWLFYGFYINKKKQLFESAIFLNLVIAVFIFGSNIPNVGERLQDRNDIYTSIWDNEIRGGDQVAQGLWGLASGGTFGQGLGEGNPNLVPAFHTDMIFTSIGEEIGWLGLLLIVSCMAILLYRSLLVGKRAGQPFAFYLAAGIAVITGVQFLIITLGSVGIIPLTGVAVPFLSYGKVSMIMNMVAFGIVFSISNNRASDNQEKQIKKYDLMIDTCKYAYALFAFVLLGTLFYYQLWERNETLIRPALMSNTQGARIVEYNPRIRLLIKELDAGNIYDRNGISLATNDKTEIENSLSAYDKAGVSEHIYRKELQQRKKRYYPFGENMFFWLGDFNNTSVAWNDSENDPHGYIAERRHLADLRGFDNLKRDKQRNVQQFKLTTQKDKAAFLYAVEKQYKYTDYDYSFLIPYLKAGINSGKVTRFNEKREKRDITLTVDAALQTKMQNEIATYATDNFKGEIWNKLRISVVALNAANGDLLCSANYPLPDMQLLKLKQDEQIRTKKFGYNEKDRKEKAYTDRDLGLTYQTPPGSTAKVMSALAGLQKLGTKAANKTYYIDAREIVETGIEPHGYNVTMEDAIVLSSNNYFINLVNDQKLYENLDSVYQTVGIRIDRKQTKVAKENNALTPYFFTQDMDKEQKKYTKEVIAVKNNAIKRYENYIEKRKHEPKYFEKMNWFETAWAWGQGSMSATPLNMARVASIVANDGIFVETQFIKQGNKTLKVEKPQTTTIVSKDEANILKRYMQKESDKHRKKGYTFPKSEKEEDRIGGKTGTPERELRYKTLNSKGKEVTIVRRYNDGWYVFFIYSPKENAPLAVAIRMERLGAGISGNAVRLADKVVLKVLSECGYLDN
jgi:cell division protein FtsW (lipid II flippase)/cell division protein FtsI/penicillin-binding protein 2